MSTHAPLLRLDTLSFSATTTSPTPHPPLQPPHNNMACMCWLPVENLKQLTVSPLRPGRCPSTAACIKTHKKPAPFSTFFLHRTRHPLPTPPPHPMSLQATTQTPLDPSHSPSIYTPTSPPSKLDYCSQELPPVDLTLPSSTTFFSGVWRCYSAVVWLKGAATRFSPSASCVPATTPICLDTRRFLCMFAA